MTANVQGNHQAAIPLQQNGDLVAARIRDFMRTNPLAFFGSKVNEDP